MVDIRMLTKLVSLVCFYKRYLSTMIPNTCVNSFALKPQSLIRTDSLYVFMMPTLPEVWKEASKTGAEEEGIKRMQESL